MLKFAYNLQTIKQKAMNKYIEHYVDKKDTASAVNVDLVCKDWSDKFSIATSEVHFGRLYHLVVKGKRKTILDVVISEKQAMEIVEKLNLYHVKSLMFPHAFGSYRCEKSIKIALDDYYKIKSQKEKLLKAISERISELEKCLSKSNDKQ